MTRNLCRSDHKRETRPLYTAEARPQERLAEPRGGNAFRYAGPGKNGATSTSRLNVVGDSPLVGCRKLGVNIGQCPDDADAPVFRKLDRIFRAFVEGMSSCYGCGMPRHSGLAIRGEVGISLMADSKPGRFVTALDFRAKRLTNTEVWQVRPQATNACSIFAHKLVNAVHEMLIDAPGASDVARLLFTMKASKSRNATPCYKSSGRILAVRTIKMHLANQVHAPCYYRESIRRADRVKIRLVVSFCKSCRQTRSLSMDTPTPMLAAQSSYTNNSRS
ncbi:hypothetical protein MRB53_038226 [Persea americana]|nr:hypothetical protein MRB53_038226 [Persea americana]